VLPAFLTESSILLCSGILDVRLEDVKNALEQAGLEILEVKAKEDWRSIRAKRRCV
jgi:ribosomal protein L11 methylase PrmA